MPNLPWLLRKYRLQLLERQVARGIAHDIEHPVCEVCGKAEGDRPLCMDHCHETGKLRGLLCSNCNVGIGMLGDSCAGVESALLYLRQKPLRIVA